MMTTKLRPWNQLHLILRLKAKQLYVIHVYYNKSILMFLLNRSVAHGKIILNET